MLYMRISWFRDRGCGFSILNTAKSSCFFSKRLSWSHDPSCEFHELTQLTLFFLIDFPLYFHHLIFCLFENKFHDLFWFVFY
jgi:hypothetical protein